MGASLCADTGCGRCAASACGGDGGRAKGFAIPAEYTPHGKLDALRECAESPWKDEWLAPKSLNFDSVLHTVAKPWENVIGAVAHDPACVQDAVRDAPKAALDAVHHSADLAKAGIFEIRALIHTNHCTVKVLCFFIALALLASSILGMLNLLDAVFRPFHYLFACFNAAFAVVIMMMDGQAGWIGRCGGARQQLFSALPCLASQAGRAVFHFYVGSINLAMLPEGLLWKVVYLSIGGALCVAGALMLVHHCWRSRRQRLRGAVPLDAPTLPHDTQEAGKAAQAALDSTKAALAEVRSYIHLIHSHHLLVKLLCFCTALALLASSILAVISVWDVVLEPFQYLIACYNVVFAVLIIVMEGKPHWFDRCGDPYGWLFSAAPCLASQTARAVLYFYVGSANLVMLPDGSSPWKAIYLAIGGALCLVGVLMLLHAHGCRHRHDCAWSPHGTDLSRWVQRAAAAP